MVYLIIIIIISVIFGFITKYMNENKGYDGGFAWGFFLGIIGIIVVACKPDISHQSSSNIYVSSDVKPTWVCGKCGQINTTDNDYCGKCANPRFTKIQKPTSWKCESCGIDNPFDFGFCGNCGSKRVETTSAEWTCPCCNALNTIHNNFCGTCGNKRPDVSISAGSIYEDILRKTKDMRSIAEMLEYICTLEQTSLIKELIVELSKKAEMERLYGKMPDSGRNVIEDFFKARRSNGNANITYVNCAKCGTQNKTDMRFCTKCGEKL